MKRNTYKIRCAPAAPVGEFVRNINVDRQNLTIRNAVVMLANVEAIGHGIMTDAITLEQVAAFGNERLAGVQGRLGHPGMSENASGRQILSVRNFRIAGERLLADLHLFEPAKRSPAFGHDAVEWLMDMAEQEPAHVALSVVIDVDPVWVLRSGEEVPADEGGYYEFSKPDSATTDLPIARVTALWCVDVVTEGAATRGMFSPHEASFYAEEAFEFLDEFRRQFNIPLSAVRTKVAQVTDRYLFSRGYEENEAMPAKKKLDGEGTATPPQTPPAPETAAEEPTVTPLAAALEQSAATQEALAPEDEMPEGDTPAEESEGDRSLTAAWEQIDALVEQNALQDERIALLEETVAQLTELSIRNTDNIGALDRNVRRIEGDPVVTMNVPRSRGTSLEALPGATALGTPVPPASARQQKPTHMSEREPAAKANPRDFDFEGDPENATLAVILKRQRALTDS